MDADVVIVQGVFEFADADQRSAFLASRAETMWRSRAEVGCLEYTFAGDPLDARRVVLTERWATQADLDAHLAAMKTAPPATEAEVRPMSRSIDIFRATQTASL